MGEQQQDESKRVAQHVLAKEIVELAHGAYVAAKAEAAHKEAFSHGTNTFSLGALRSTLVTNARLTEKSKAPRYLRSIEVAKELIAHKKAYATSANPGTTTTTVQEPSKDESTNIVTLPLSMLTPGSFPRILHAAGLATSKSEAHRLIAKKGAYVVVPNSGSPETPTALQWVNIEAGAAADPNHFLVDWEALVLRAGKSKIQVCRIVKDEQFEGEGKMLTGSEEVEIEGEGETLAGSGEIEAEQSEGSVQVKKPDETS